MTSVEDIPDDDSDPGEYEGEECPVCGAGDCAEHMVVNFVDGYPHDGFGALTLRDWNEIAQSLQARLVEAWLSRQKQVDGPKGLAELLPTLADSERREILREVTRAEDRDEEDPDEEDPDEEDLEVPSYYLDEVYAVLDARGELPDVERIEGVMREALESLRGMAEQASSFDKGPCTFVGNSIYSSNPKATVRRFKMRLGL